VDYLVTGTWSKKAADEAKKYCKVHTRRIHAFTRDVLSQCVLYRVKNCRSLG
jgi:phosphoserine aminotransferase